MSKPLSLKSNLLSTHHEKHHILTVSEVMKNFEAKSPSHKILNSQFRSNSAKNLSNLKNENSKNQKKSSKCPQSQIKGTQLAVSKLSNDESVKNNNKQVNSSNIKNLIMRKITEKSRSFFKSEPLKVKEMNKKIESRQLIKEKNDFKRINGIKIEGVSSSKHLQVPSLNLNKKDIYQRPAPLSDRLPNQKKTKYYPISVKGSKSIRLNTKYEDDIISIKSCKNTNSCQFFRKISKAETMSIPSKHTISMQHFQDYEQLFPKNDKPSRRDSKDQENNPLSTLLQVKNKILKQIHSLDQKLLAVEDKREVSKQECQTKAKVICLKRKKEKCLGNGVDN